MRCEDVHVREVIHPALVAGRVTDVHAHPLLRDAAVQQLDGIGLDRSHSRRQEEEVEELHVSQIDLQRLSVLDHHLVDHVLDVGVLTQHAAADGVALKLRAAAKGAVLVEDHRAAGAVRRDDRVGGGGVTPHYSEASLLSVPCDALVELGELVLERVDQPVVHQVAGPLGLVVHAHHDAAAVVDHPNRHVAGVDAPVPKPGVDASAGVVGCRHHQVAGLHGTVDACCQKRVEGVPTRDEARAVEVEGDDPPNLAAEALQEPLRNLLDCCFQHLALVVHHNWPSFWVFCSEKCVVLFSDGSLPM